MEDARRHFDRALRTFEARVAKGADDPFTRYYIADLHALRGDADRAFDSLERVFARPARADRRARSSAIRISRRSRTTRASPRFAEPRPSRTRDIHDARACSTS